MRLFHPADRGLGDAHPAGERDLGQLGGLPQRGEAHGISPIGFPHVTADPRDILRDIRTLGELGDAVITAK